MKIGISIGAMIAIGVAVWFALANTQNVSQRITEGTATTTPQACNMDAKICPDGSAVGRMGPACEFAECPPQERTEATVTTFLGGSVTAMNITVNPRIIISDSRCPRDVQCVWAGTVELRTVISSEVAHGEHVLKLGEPQLFGDYTVQLTNVEPGKTKEGIPESSYRFTFRIMKK